VTREVFWNIPPLGRVTFYALAAATLAVFGYGVFLNLRRVLKGRETSISWDEIRSNLFKTTTEILSNRTVARRHRLAGLMHAGIMWGFIALFIGTVIISIEFDVFQEILGRSHGFWTGSFFLGYELTLDTMGTVFLLSLAVALARRYVFRTPQLSWKPIDFFLPASLLLIGLTGFIVEGLRLATTGSQLAYSPYWSPTGFLFSRLWQGMAASAARRVHGYLW